MESKIHWLEITARHILNVGHFIAKIMLAAMLIVVIANVVLRYFFHSPLIWGDEVMVNLMMLMIFLSAGQVMIEKNGHIRMTAVTERLSPDVQNILWIICCFIGIGYTSFLIYSGVWLTAQSINTGLFSTTTNWPTAPWQVVMVCGLVLLLIAIVLVTVKRIRIAQGTLAEIENLKPDVNAPL